MAFYVHYVRLFLTVYQEALSKRMVESIRRQTAEVHIKIVLSTQVGQDSHFTPVKEENKKHCCDTQFSEYMG